MPSGTSSAEVTYDYVDEVNMNLTCGICTSPLIDPVTTTRCGHVFCRGCIRQAITHKAECPIDRLPLNKAGLQNTEHTIKVMLDELMVKCTNEGCGKVMQRGLLVGHTNSCLGSIVKCRESGCGLTTTRAKQAHHRAYDCFQRKMECSTCGVLVTFKERLTHPHNVGSGELCIHCKMPTNTTPEQHRWSCPLQAIPCPHANRGCTKIMLRDQLKQHLSVCIQEALEPYRKDHEKRCHRLEKANDAIAAENAQLGCEISELTSRVTRLEAREAHRFERRVRIAYAPPSPGLETHGQRRASSSSTSEHSPVPTRVDSATRLPVEERTEERVRPSRPVTPTEVTRVALQEEFDFVQRYRDLSTLLRDVSFELSTYIDENDRRATRDILRVEEEIDGLRAIMTPLRTQSDFMAHHANANANANGSLPSAPSLPPLIIPPPSAVSSSTTHDSRTPPAAPVSSYPIRVDRFPARSPRAQLPATVWRTSERRDTRSPPPSPNPASAHRQHASGNMGELLPSQPVLETNNSVDRSGEPYSGVALNIQRPPPAPRTPPPQRRNAEYPTDQDRSSDQMWTAGISPIASGLSTLERQAAVLIEAYGGAMATENTNTNTNSSSISGASADNNTLAFTSHAARPHPHIYRYIRQNGYTGRVVANPQYTITSSVVLTGVGAQARPVTRVARGTPMAFPPDDGAEYVTIYDNEASVRAKVERAMRRAIEGIKRGNEQVVHLLDSMERRDRARGRRN